MNPHEIHFTPAEARKPTAAERRIVLTVAAAVLVGLGPLSVKSQPGYHSDL